MARPTKDWQDKLDRANADPRYQAWLGMMDVIDLEFIDGDVTGLPDPPYTAEGLRVAEAAALDRFDDLTTVFSRENQEISDRFIRFLGQTFVESCGGRWVNVPDPKVATSGVPRIAMPYWSDYFDPKSTFTSAIARRTGREWAFVYNNAVEDYDKWKTAQN